MEFLKLFGLKPSAARQREIQAEYNAMCEAIANETPEQKAQFYLEVAAALGNESATRLLTRNKTIN